MASKQKAGQSAAAQAPQPEPFTAQCCAQLLASMGVEEYEPRVVNQLLDFMYRYTTDVLLDAEIYSEHAGGCLSGSSWSLK